MAKNGVVLESGEDDEPSLGSFSSHAGPVHGLQVYDGLLYTCSGDNTARAYSLKVHYEEFKQQHSPFHTLVKRSIYIYTYLFYICLF